MPVNLLNEKDLNNYLADIVYHGQEMEVFKSGDFKSTAFVEQNKDAIVRSMLLQWCKHRLRSHLSEDIPEHRDFLIPVKADESNLPVWAERCLKEGNPIHRFDANKIPAKLTDSIGMIRDYLYSAAESYINKTLARVKDTNVKGKEEVSPKLRIDYLKTQEAYDTFAKTLDEAQKWHDIMAEKAELKKRNEAMYQASLSGTHSVMKLDDGMEIVQLTTPEALDYESEYMGHCVGKGGYDKDVAKGTTKIYSLRDADGMPHATLEVRKDNDKEEIHQCKGKGNKAPVAKYLPYVQEFVKAKDFEIVGDEKNIGLFKLYDEDTEKSQYYDIFNLPKNKRLVFIGYLDLSDMELRELPDLSNVIIEGSFDCSGNNLTSLKGAPRKVEFVFNCRDNDLLDSLQYVSICKKIHSDIDVQQKYGISNCYWSDWYGEEEYNITYYSDLDKNPIFKNEKQNELNEKRKDILLKIRKNEAAKNISPIKGETKPKLTGLRKQVAKINITLAQIKQSLKRNSKAGK